MLPGAPSRLPASFPLRRALAHAHPGEPLGAWVRMGRWPLHLRAGGCALIASADLGILLRRAARILVRSSYQPAVVPAERLIAWRTLQIVVGSPCLPELPELRSLFPGLRVGRGRITLPLGLGSGQAALAVCARAGVPVSATWIEYQAAGSG